MSKELMNDEVYIKGFILGYDLFTYHCTVSQMARLGRIFIDGFIPIATIIQ